jgi:Arc/MetJ family transcription regulator
VAGQRNDQRLQLDEELAALVLRELGADTDVLEAGLVVIDAVWRFGRVTMSTCAAATTVRWRAISRRSSRDSARSRRAGSCSTARSW